MTDRPLFSLSSQEPMTKALPAELAVGINNDATPNGNPQHRSVGVYDRPASVLHSSLTITMKTLVFTLLLLVLLALYFVVQ